jgi:DNA-binding NarL/FixJ family response regulator
VDTDGVPLANLLIVEDEVLARTTLATALEYGGFQVVGSVASAPAAIEVAKEFLPEVALLDLDLGLGPTGIDVAIALRKLNPRIGIVFLTTFVDPRFSKAENLTLPKGSRYLSKQDIGGISKVASTILQAKFHPLTREPTPSRPSELNEHQIAVLKLLAAGLSNLEIGKQLGVSEKAVEHLITRIAKTLGIARDKSQNLRVQLMRKYSTFVGKDLPES